MGDLEGPSKVMRVLKKLPFVSDGVAKAEQFIFDVKSASEKVESVIGQGNIAYGNIVKNIENVQRIIERGQIAIVMLDDKIAELEAYLEANQNSPKFTYFQTSLAGLVSLRGKLKADSHDLKVNLEARRATAVKMMPELTGLDISLRSSLAKEQGVAELEGCQDALTALYTLSDTLARRGADQAKNTVDQTVGLLGQTAMSADTMAYVQRTHAKTRSALENSEGKIRQGNRKLLEAAKKMDEELAKGTSQIGFCPVSPNGGAEVLEITDGQKN